MPREIYLVKVGMSMTEGMVAEWHIPDGTSVTKGELLYALETEKVNMDVDAEYDGTVKHLVEAGVMQAPGDIVGYIYEAGEEIPDTLLGSPTAGSTVRSPGAVTATPAQSEPCAAAAPVSSSSATRVKSSPLVRRLAAEKGIDLSTITGTGPGGRIVQTDIETATAVDKPAAKENAPPLLQGDTIPVRGMRKTIASRMYQSLQESAQLTMHMEALVDETVKLRQSLIEEWAAEGVKPTYTDLVIKAVAKTLTAHSMMNSQFMGDEILLKREINIGMAVALPQGLVVPVIRNVDQLSIKELAQESSRLAAAARAGGLELDDYAGGTFTVTALGMYGVDSFTPIINQPQSSILGVNRIYDGLEWEGDKPLRTQKMNLSLTWDHRILDGAPAAEFLSEVCKVLSAPWRLLV